MQSDQKSATVVTTGALVPTGGQARLTSVVLTGSSAASSVTFKTGGTSGTVLLTLHAVAGMIQVDIPGAGIRFADGIYATVADVNVDSVVAFYTG